MKYKDIKRNLIIKSINYGIIASLILFSFYFFTLTIANSFQHFIQQFTEMWYLILLLVIGFGIQIGLYVYIKEFIKLKNILGVTGGVAATSGVSSTSMIACCLHHLSDILPIIGLGALGLFANKYQLLFIGIGILSNLIGISWMFNIIQKHTLYTNKGILKTLMNFNMKRVFYFMLIFSILLIFMIILII